MPDPALLDRFLSAPDEEAMEVIAEEPGVLLSDEALAELDRRIAARPGEAVVAALQERRELLVTLRGMQQQFAAAAAEMEKLSETERAFLTFAAIPNSLGVAALVAENDDESLDKLAATAQAKLAGLDAESDEARSIRTRLDDLTETRGAGREAAQTRLEEAQAAASRMGDSLIEWIQTPDWSGSAAYLSQHRADLLADDAHDALLLLQLTNPNAEQIPLHIQLRRRCREQGIPAAYAQLRQELNLQRQMETPLGQSVIAFVQADDDDAARLLETPGTPLLSVDARQLLEELLDAGQASADTRAVERLSARLTQWKSVSRQRTGGSLRRAAPIDEWQPQPQGDWLERTEQRAVVPERGQHFTVVSAVNSAIGPDATVFNVVNVGEIPLAWHTPRQTRPDLARDAVGREAELAELHRRLTGQQAAALVGKGAAPGSGDRAALRGMAGIGKTVLAAMYATRHAADYPGGVIWLTVGPARRKPEDLAGEWQSLASHAYADPIQAQKVLENCLLSPEAVQGLLAGHGRLLIVCDDVWSEEVAAELAGAAPPEAALLLTSRDYDVAYALAHNPDAIQQLDLLNQTDARLLLQSRAPGLPDDLADRMAKGLGYHAQALNLAGAALQRRGTHRFAQTAQEILRRVTGGRGFGDLPRMDKAERVSEVEIALGYSYELLGEGDRGTTHQSWLRSLGVFAQEADFDSHAAASLWQIDVAQAEEFLLALDGLALLQEIGPDPTPPNPGFSPTSRWQQHAILRAYALSLQDEEERLRYPQRHADHYLALARTCYQAQPRRGDRIDREFQQIEHTFGWCQTHSPSRTLQLVALLDDFMRNRGKATQLDGWLRSALAASDATGARLGKANTLKSLGDLESRLGNIEAARGHYDAALPLYEAEQARLGKANTLQSLGDLERRLGNIEAARGHYDAALTLYRFVGDPVGEMNVYIGLARMSAAVGERENALSHFDRVFVIADRIGFGDHPVTRDLRSEYNRLKLAHDGASVPLVPLPDREIEPLAAALSALLQADSNESLAQALADHPVLREAEALFALAGLLNQALQAQDSETVARLVLLAGILFQVYNSAHAESIDPQPHAGLIDLGEQILPLAQPIDGDLAGSLQERLGWLCNSLGNHYADGEGKDLSAAIAAYSRGLAFAPQTPILLRNRAGVHIEVGHRAAAQADIDAAAAIEPDAPRLAELRGELAKKRGEDDRE